MAGMTEAQTFFTIVSVIAGVSAISMFLRRVFRLIKRVIHFLDDYFGTEERAGVPAVPGMAERIKKIEGNIDYLCVRIDKIEKELYPNHGTSLRDSVNRIEKRVLELEDEIID